MLTQTASGVAKELTRDAVGTTDLRTLKPMIDRLDAMAREATMNSPVEFEVEYRGVEFMVWGQDGVWDVRAADGMFYETLDKHPAFNTLGSEDMPSLGMVKVFKDFNKRARLA